MIYDRHLVPTHALWWVLLLNHTTHPVHCIKHNTMTMRSAVAYTQSQSLMPRHTIIHLAVTCRYGCEKQPGKDVTPLSAGLPVPGSLGGLPGVPVRHQERVFPLMLALNAPDLFSYRSCNFKVSALTACEGVGMPSGGAPCAGPWRMVMMTTFSNGLPAVCTSTAAMNATGMC